MPWPVTWSLRPGRGLIYLQSFQVIFWWRIGFDWWRVSTIKTLLQRPGSRQIPTSVDGPVKLGAATFGLSAFFDMLRRRRQFRGNALATVAQTTQIVSAFPNSASEVSLISSLGTEVLGLGEVRFYGKSILIKAV